MPNVIDLTVASSRLPLAPAGMVSSRSASPLSEQELTTCQPRLFRFRYPSAWLTESGELAGTNGSEVLDQMGAVDPFGLSDDGFYLNYLGVFALQLTYEVTESRTYPHL